MNETKRNGGGQQLAWTLVYTTLHYMLQLMGRVFYPAGTYQSTNLPTNLPFSFVRLAVEPNQTTDP